MTATDPIAALPVPPLLPHWRTHNLICVDLTCTHIEFHNALPLCFCFCCCCCCCIVCRIVLLCIVRRPDVVSHAFPSPDRAEKPIETNAAEKAENERLAKLQAERVARETEAAEQAHLVQILAAEKAEKERRLAEERRLAAEAEKHRLAEERRSAAEIEARRLAAQEHRLAEERRSAAEIESRRLSVVRSPFTSSSSSTCSASASSSTCSAAASSSRAQGDRLLVAPRLSEYAAVIGIDFGTSGTGTTRCN